MSEKLLNIYGGRKSKKGKHLNVTLIREEGEEKKYFNTCVVLEEFVTDKTKPYAVIKDEYAFIKIPLIKHDERQTDKAEETKETKEENPF